ncbi:hypothetical protein Btru_066062 [Bulinus truncatus]|nr:hypothetical protein Btru_066062 [Bulinus truncatus]
MIVEMMPKSRRALPEQIDSFLWTAAVLLMCFIAYIMRHLSWNYTQLTLSMTSVYVLIQWWFIDESLRWLCEVKKYTEVEQLVDKMARINGVDPKKSLDLLKNSVFSVHCHDIDDSNNKTEPDVDDKENKNVNKDKNLSSFIKNRNLLKLTIITSSLWFIDALTYDGLMMISPDLTDDFYLGFVLGVVIEFPATIIFCLLIDRIGRKNCINIFYPVAGVFLLVSTILLNTQLSDYIPEHYWFSLVLSLLGRLSLSTAISATNIYVPELFPTSVRNTGYGIAGLFSYLGSTIAPYTRTLSRHIPWAPDVVFGSLCLLVPVTTRILPETKGHELTQTLDDLDKIMKKTSIIETKL